MWGQGVLRILPVAKTPSANLLIRKSGGRGAGEEGGGGENVSSVGMWRGEGTVLAAHKQSYHSRNTLGIRNRPGGI